MNSAVFNIRSASDCKAQGASGKAAKSPVFNIPFSEDKPISAKHARSDCRATQIRVLAFKEFGDRFRSGWVLACILLWLGAIGFASFLGLIQMGRIGVQGYERTVVSMLNLVQYLVPLLGLLLGHDLIVSEKEERTLRLLLSSGVSRSRLLLGKFLGACLTIAVPLVAGFLVAGLVIGLAARDSGLAPFLKLAFSGVALGIVFVAIGVALSTFSKTRVQAIVAAVLMWCAFVFVFDLIALGITVSYNSPAASREIELVCDAMHVNAAADIHSDADTISSAPRQTSAGAAASVAGVACLAVNPVDLFRAVNLSSTLGVHVPVGAGVASFVGWIALSLLLSRWKLNRTDL
ncbi:MAG TPA: ABC transporter permease subunit [Candidatus Dormibacteraeota bacterium]|nr:ABC transporter permease subunit [Candidatus Dormibacteraeota bacterium]